jgi:hypothetical protein
MATGSLTEQVTEQVADHLEDAAQVTRQIDKARIGLIAGGFLVGAAVGFYLGYRFNQKKIRAEEIKRADKAIDEMREYYHEHYTILKPSPEEVVKEKGYDEAPRPTRPPVPVAPAPVVKTDIPPDKSKDEGWDWTMQLADRTPSEPYVIHQSEFNSDQSGYNKVAWTYYDTDDVLVDEDEQPVTRPADVIGEENLLKFGLGADDFDVVFVRNELIDMDFEIVRTKKSYEAEVQGLDPHDIDTS